jgi:hypothetical protein
MATDVGSDQVILFAGGDPFGFLADTWTWSGTDWSLHLAGSIGFTPRAGRPGTAIRLEVWGFAPGEVVRLTFLDSSLGRVFLLKVRTRRSGCITTQITIPSNATPGTQRVRAKGRRAARSRHEGSRSHNTKVRGHIRGSICVRLRGPGRVGSGPRSDTLPATPDTPFSS